MTESGSPVVFENGLVKVEGIGKGAYQWQKSELMIQNVSLSFQYSWNTSAYSAAWVSDTLPTSRGTSFISGLLFLC